MAGYGFMGCPALEGGEEWGFGGVDWIGVVRWECGTKEEVSNVWSVVYTGFSNNRDLGSLVQSILTACQGLAALIWLKHNSKHSFRLQQNTNLNAP